MRAPTSRASVSFIFTTILLDCLGIGIIVPTLPDVVRRLAHDPTIINDFYGYFMASYAVMQFFASPLLGSLSDRYGRRPVLLVSLLGAGLDYLMMAFAPNLVVLFIGRMISGLTGASMTVATAYIADVSDDSNRSANFGLIGAAFGVGFIAGPMIGGLLGTMGPTVPFIGAAVLNLANFAFGYFVLPESLPPEARKIPAHGVFSKGELLKINPIKSLFKILRPSAVLPLIVAYALMMLSGQVHPSVFVLYTEAKFQWTSVQVGLALSLVGVSAVIVQGFVTRILVPRLGENRALKVGLVIEATGYICYALVAAPWMVYMTIAYSAMAGIGMPSLRALISKDTPSEHQGELQGSLISIASLMAVFAPLIYTQTFDWALKSNGGLPVGLPYFVAATVAGISLTLVLLRARKMP